MKLDKTTLALVISGLAMIVSYSFPINDQYTTAAIYLGAIPLLTIILVFDESLKEYGFSIGDWRKGLKYTCYGIVILIILLVAGAIIFNYQSDYSFTYLFKKDHLITISKAIMMLVSWEVFFRGFILFGTSSRFKEYSYQVQAIPYALMHIGKPPIEAIASLPFGMMMGYIAYKTKSILYPILIHLSLNIILILIIAFM